MILTFEDSEEEILNHIISYVGTGARAFQVAEIAKTNLNFNGLEIDITNRLVRKQRQEIDLTFIKLMRERAGSFLSAFSCFLFHIMWLS